MSQGAFLHRTHWAWSVLVAICDCVSVTSTTEAGVVGVEGERLSDKRLSGRLVSLNWRLDSFVAAHGNTAFNASARRITVAIALTNDIE